MKFNEIKEIDTLMECVPYVDDIMSDTKLFDSVKEKSWIQAAAPIYKAHKESIDKLMDILGERPESDSAIDTIKAVAKILTGIYMDAEIRAFFMLSCESMRSAISAMANTEEKQSEDS